MVPQKYKGEVHYRLHFNTRNVSRMWWAKKEEEEEEEARYGICFINPLL